MWVWQTKIRMASPLWHKLAHRAQTFLCCFPCSQIVIFSSEMMTIWVKSDEVFIQILTFFTQSPFLNKKKLLFDGFVMPTWVLENKSQRKKETENPSPDYLPNFMESFNQSSLPCSLGLPTLGVYTMRTNLRKRLDLLIFCIYSLNFSLEFFIMIYFVTNQLNISKFLQLQRHKTLISY